MNEQETLHPWNTIWRDPRGTVRALAELNPRHSMILLASLGGIGNAFSYAANFGLGEMMGTTQVIAFCLLVGPVSGFAAIYLWSWLLGYTCQFLGGIASRQELRVAVAWQWAPVVYMLPLWGVKYILFRDELFLLTKPFIESNGLLSALSGLFGFIDFGISIFSLYILFSALAELNGFSIFKSIGAFAIVMLALTLPALLLMRAVMPL